MIFDQKKLINNYKLALLKMYNVTKDVLLLEVETMNNKYSGVLLTSLKTNMEKFFKTGHFPTDFNNAIKYGQTLIASGKYENKNLENSYNSFSNGIFLSSTFDDFVMYYECSIETDDQDNILSISDIKK